MAIRMWPSLKGSYPMDLKCTICSGFLNSAGKIVVRTAEEKQRFRDKHSHGLAKVAEQFKFEGWKKD